MSKKVLIVEDEEAVRRVLSRQLRANGYAPTAAGSGEEALSVAAQEKPDVILLDVTLPGIDGFETLRRLQEDSRTTAIPVVMLTGAGASEHIVRGYQFGAAYYIPKPYELDELLRGLELALLARSD